MLAQHALITGAGSGIGAAIAVALNQAGLRVSLLGRRAEALESTRQTLIRSDAAGVFVADVTQPAVLRAAISAASAAHGPIDILVNNAGAARSAPLAKTDETLWNDMLAVNLTAALHAMQMVLPSMVARGFGRIVNIASTAGLKGYRYVAAYCAAKHGLVGLTRASAVELAQTGVTVNAVCPGFADTALVRESIANIVAKTRRSEDDALKSLVAANPQGRLVQPAEVAATVLWLCGAESASITGQSIAVAGGEIC
jgi:NAD(P)-dependent dehydrogenase (short-subunit alcohol dehydrogenase family)